MRVRLWGPERPWSYAPTPAPASQRKPFCSWAGTLEYQCEPPDHIRKPATSVTTRSAQAAATSRISARVGLALSVSIMGSSASSCIKLPLRHVFRCARQVGRLIAREHREPRPACSPKVLYSAGHPTEAGACVHRECGRSSRSRLERETGLRRCLPLGKAADSTHCSAQQLA